jgi:hypothetical protein
MRSALRRQSNVRKKKGNIMVRMLENTHTAAPTYSIAEVSGSAMPLPDPDM